MTVRVWLSALSAVLMVAACSKPSGGPATASPPAASAPTAAQTAAADSERDDADRDPDAHDSCALLDVKEVEAALGPLAGPPYRSDANGNAPSIKGDSCRYEARDLHSLEVNVTWTGGSTLQKVMSIPGQVAAGTQVKNARILFADSTVAGEWDEVYVLGCCRINAFLDDSMVILDFSASKLSHVQAVELVNKALLRLKTPLPVDGRAGVKPALERLAGAIKKRPACQLVTRPEAEAILGKLAADPAGDESRCTFRYTTDKGAEDSIEMAVNWTSGYGEFRDSQDLHAKASDGVDLEAGTAALANLGKAMQDGGKSFEQSMKKLEGKAPPGPPRDLTGPWEQAVVNFPDFLAVKKNVLVTVKGDFMRPIDLGQKLAARAVEKL